MNAEVGRTAIPKLGTYSHFRGEEPCSTHIEASPGTASLDMRIHYGVGCRDPQVSYNPFTEQIEVVGNRIAKANHRTYQECGYRSFIGPEPVNPEAELTAYR